MNHPDGTPVKFVQWVTSSSGPGKWHMLVKDGSETWCGHAIQKWMAKIHTFQKPEMHDLCRQCTKSA